MDIDDVNSLFLNQPDELIRPDWEQNQKRQETDERVAFSKRHLHPDFKGGKPQSGGFCLRTKSFARKKEEHLVTPAFQITRKIRHHVRDTSHLVVIRSNQ
jgi:hypothetical protein